MLNNATVVVLDWLKKFIFLSRLEFFKIRDALIVLILERVDFLPETRNYVIRQLQFMAVLDSLKSRCKCGEAKSRGKCPNMDKFHRNTSNALGQAAAPQAQVACTDGLGNGD
jgi:hypothetical protein